MDQAYVAGMTVSLDVDRTARTNVSLRGVREGVCSFLSRTTRPHLTPLTSVPCIIMWTFVDLKLLKRAD
jgi:hypothetical protein